VAAEGELLTGAFVVLTSARTNLILCVLLLGALYHYMEDGVLVFLPDYRYAGDLFCSIPTVHASNTIGPELVLKKCFTLKCFKKSETKKVKQKNLILEFLLNRNGMDDRKKNIEAFMQLDARIALGLSQSTFADILHVHRAQVSLLESRQSRSLPFKAALVLGTIERSVFYCLQKMSQVDKVNEQPETDLRKAFKRQLLKAENELLNLHFRLPKLEKKLTFFTIQLEFLSEYIAQLDREKDFVLYASLELSKDYASNSLIQLREQVNLHMKLKKIQLEVSIAWLKEQLAH
jgi:hypothetical protein